jgi:hypothetical protein
VGGVGSHGNMAAVGTLNFPLFREARLRGDTEAAQAHLDAVNAQLADMRGQIDQQVRSALLDVEATAKLVEVARSNVDLATRALADETDRVNAGVDDNLPLVTAQATLASAQSNWSKASTSTTCPSWPWPAPPASWKRSTGFIWASADTAKRRFHAQPPSVSSHSSAKDSAACGVRATFERGKFESGRR